MPHKEVQRKIDDLKAELGQTPKETRLFEEKLEQAKDGIERFTPEAVKDFTKMLHVEAGEFEIDHPRITELINNVMTSLSNLGI